MQYRPLGRTGIKVSPYALGALALGTPIGNPDHDDSARIIHKALDAGINLIDTSDTYGDSECAAALLKALSDERRIDAVEQLIPLAELVGLPMTHLAMAFAIAHPGVTSAIIGPHTMEQLDDLLASADVTLSDDILDRIDEIVPPGADVGTLDQAYLPPALLNPSLRRRPAGERAAA
jgi:aryl-alcohol dehydrogenase-like predicted oxidoreductase